MLPARCLNKYYFLGTCPLAIPPPRPSPPAHQQPEPRYRAKLFGERGPKAPHSPLVASVDLLDARSRKSGWMKGGPRDREGRVARARARARGLGPPGTPFIKTEGRDGKKVYEA
jgi:hypothetical protein